MKIRQLGDELFHAERRKNGWTADTMKRIVAFRNYANALIKYRNSIHLLVCALSVDCPEDTN
jgi:hypothetical protein